MLRQSLSPSLFGTLSPSSSLFSRTLSVSVSSSSLLSSSPSFRGSLSVSLSREPRHHFPFLSSSLSLSSSTAIRCYYTENPLAPSLQEADVAPKTSHSPYDAEVLEKILRDGRDANPFLSARPPLKVRILISLLHSLTLFLSLSLSLSPQKHFHCSLSITTPQLWQKGVMAVSFPLLMPIRAISLVSLFAIGVALGESSHSFTRRPLFSFSFFSFFVLIFSLSNSVSLASGRSCGSQTVCSPRSPLLR